MNYLDLDKRLTEATQGNGAIRPRKFTMKEFNSLDRAENGDLIDISLAFLWITTKQRKLVTGDDKYRLNELDDEMNYLLNEI